MLDANSKSWPLVSVVIPCYNAMKFLPICLPSILALDYPNLELIIIDDCSTDNSYQYIQENFKQFQLIKNETNRGFAYTVEKGFWLSKGKYFFMVNQDTVHQPDYLKIAVEVMEKDPKIAAFGGKVYKYDFEVGQPTKIIDTVGQIIYKNRRVVDEGQGQEDHGQFDQAGEVFGVSGQNPLYRREALEQVAIPVPGQEHPEVIDQDFFMYKEDVDLAWRLRLFGWKAWYDPRAVAWHGRGTSAVKREKNAEIVQNRKLLSKFQKYYSIKNRYLAMAKNEFASIYFQHLLRIWWNDLLYFGYNLIFDTHNLTAYLAALRQMPKIWAKRRWIKANRQIKAWQMKPWFKSK